MIHLWALKAIHIKMRNPANWTHDGICGRYANELILRDIEVDAEKLLDAFAAWPAFSGSRFFPVPPDTSDQAPSTAFMAKSPETMWDRETSQYAEMRWRLLEWLIKTEEEKRAPELK